jgi:hypothetical protein
VQWLAVAADKAGFSRKRDAWPRTVWPAVLHAMAAPVAEGCGDHSAAHAEVAVLYAAPELAGAAAVIATAIWLLAPPVPGAAPGGLAAVDGAAPAVDKRRIRTALALVQLAAGVGAIERRWLQQLHRRLLGHE